MPLFPGCTDPRSLSFAICSHEECGVSPGLSSAVELSGHSRAAEGPLKPFECSKGNPRASQQISASPTLSAGSGVAPPREKCSSWSRLSPQHWTKCLPGMEKQPWSWQQPSGAVRRHRAPHELKLLPFKERQRLRHPGTNPHSFCRLPTVACTQGPHWPSLMVPTAAQSHDGQPGQQSPSYRRSLENPRAREEGLLTWLQHSPAAPSIISVLPRKPARPAPSQEQAVGRMMLFHKAFIKPLPTHPTNALSALLH